MKTRTIKIRSNTGWFNDEVSKAKHKRRQLERKWRTSKLEIDRQLYCQHRQLVISLIRKTVHYSSVVSKCSGDQKQLFRVANTLLNRSKESPLPQHESSELLANRFSLFFQSKIVLIRAGFTPIVPDICAQPATITLTTFNTASPTEISSAIFKSPSKSCDLDPIPTWLLKQCVEFIGPAITQIVNHSLQSGIVPSTLKVAYVRPSLKKPALEPNELKNYRPVSNLSYISTLLERIAFSRLTTFLRQNNLLDKYQSAYRQNHSVETLLVHISNHILRQMDVGKVTSLVLLDLSSAFDTVDHTNRLHSLGVHGTALQWFTSYLTDRHQSVCIDGVKSAPCCPWLWCPSMFCWRASPFHSLHSPTWQDHSKIQSTIPLLRWWHTAVSLI